MQQQGTPEAVLAAIAQSTNEVTQGWMRVMSMAPWLNDLQKGSARLQADYFDKQTRLWTSLLAGRSEALVEPDDGDRRFVSKEWRSNAYYDYLRQSYLLMSRYLEELVDKAELD